MRQFSQIKLVGILFFIYLIAIVTIYIVLTILFYFVLVLMGFLLFSRGLLVYYSKIKSLVDNLTFYEICQFFLKRLYLFFGAWEITKKKQLEFEQEKKFDIAVEFFNKSHLEYLQEVEASKKLAEKEKVKNEEKLC